MACCCKTKPHKSDASCLGRCDLRKHRCLDREEVKPGPVPKNMGWLYTARDAPEHQLRCGWRPGHISCTVLRRIEAHNCMKNGESDLCTPCTRPPCPRASLSPKCLAICTSTPSCTKTCTPLIRIIRHGGEYSICTKPSTMITSPSGPYPLKYVLNTEQANEIMQPNQTKGENRTRFSVEAKFNDYHFDYASSQSSFVLDFSPPEPKCYKPCSKNIC